VYNKFVVCSSLFVLARGRCTKPVTCPVVIDRYSCLYVSGLDACFVLKVLRTAGTAAASPGNVVYKVSGRTVYTGYESLQWADTATQDRLTRGGAGCTGPERPRASVGSVCTLKCS
jgi:hypothetical protein